MDSDILESYDAIIASTKEVLKYNQRHLFVNSLELLNSTTNITAESHVEHLNNTCLFWYSEILPLCFDDFCDIQDAAVKSLEHFLKYVDPTVFQNDPAWPVIKTKIIECYCFKINKIRNDNNENWYNIWCILIRILNQEIIRSASVINIFLNIVEQGFRSINYNTRAEAFLCWKVLIEIFAKNNELLSLKRIKLISIPLRSSQAKTINGAVNKFRVWWYFLLKLNKSVYKTIDLTFEPFLQYCFGVNNCQNNNSNTYPTVMEMSVITLIKMLGQPTKDLMTLFVKHELDYSSDTLINAFIMEKAYTLITKSCYEATIFIFKKIPNYKNLLPLLWGNFVKLVIEAKRTEIYTEFCNTIQCLITIDNENPDLAMRGTIMEICKLFGTNGQFLIKPSSNNDTFDLHSVTKTILALSNLLIETDDNYVEKSVAKEIFKNIYDIDNFKESLKYWEMLKDLIHNLTRSGDINDFNNFELRIYIWKILLNLSKNYMSSKMFEFRINKNANIINELLLFPFKKLALTQISLQNNFGNFNSFNNDEESLTIWKEVMIVAREAEGNNNFAGLLEESFNSFCENREKVPKLQDILCCFINCWETDFELHLPTCSLEIISNFISQPPSFNDKNYSKIVKTVTEYFDKLTTPNMLLIFNEIKMLTTALAQAEKKKYIARGLFNNFKKIILNGLKNHQNDSKFYKEYNSLIKQDDFTVIHSIWSLNPDKLTEHQKEKMKERNTNIPALYNDMNSQESGSLKPWTPNKLIIENPNKNKDEPSSDNIPAESKRVTMAIDIDFNDPTTSDSNELQGKNDTVKSSDKKMNSPKSNGTNVQSNSSSKSKKDEKKKKSLILKQLTIDTVEGNTFLKTQNNIDMNDSRKSTRKSKNKHNNVNGKSSEPEPDSIKENTKKSKHSRKSLDFNKKSFYEMRESDDVTSDDVNGIEPQISEEEIGPSQSSESLLSRRSHKSSTSSLTNSSGDDKKKDSIRNGEDKKKDPIKNGLNKLTNDTNLSTLQPSYLFSKKSDNNSNDNTFQSNPLIRLIQSPNNLQQDSSDATSGPEIQNDLKRKSPEPSNDSIFSPRSESIAELRTLNKSLDKSHSLKNVNEMDTQLNTESFSVETNKLYDREIPSETTETEETEQSDVEVNTKNDEVYRTPTKQIKLQEIQSPAFSPIKAKSNENKSNRSIVTSLECHDIQERNNEFLNNTLNISPIFAEITEKTNSHNDQDPLSELEIEEGDEQILKSSKSEQLTTESKMNSSTPNVKQRQKTNLTGRGAQIMNLIRNHKADLSTSNVFTKTALMKNDIDDSKLLVFSKTLPSPTASPSASILKRKPRCGSVDDLESPAHKRKRVSFHDPPVSVTKQYLKHDDEDKPINNTLRLMVQSKDIIQMNPNNTQADVTPTMHKLKRKSRADSMLELLRYKETQEYSAKRNIMASKSDDTNDHQTENHKNHNEAANDMDVISWICENNKNINNDNHDNANNNDNSDKDSGTDEDNTSSQTGQIYFPDEISILTYVYQKYPCDLICQKYIDNNVELSERCVGNLMKMILGIMQKNDKIRSNILEMLSENHPKEFLDHAIQENLSSVVCDRINSEAVIDYVFEKAKINGVVRKTVRDKFNDILTTDKYKDDNRELFKVLLRQQHLSDEDCFESIETMIKNRIGGINNSTKSS